MRPYTEWADRLYVPGEQYVHVVPWVDINKVPLCGRDNVLDYEWHGTGDWDETETAAWMPMCPACQDALDIPDATDPSVEKWLDALTPKKEKA